VNEWEACVKKETWFQAPMGKELEGLVKGLGAVIDPWSGGECRARFHVAWCRSIAYVGNDLVLFLFLDAIGK
jgi:hypothetical protein